MSESNLILELRQGRKQNVSADAHGEIELEDHQASQQTQLRYRLKRFEAENFRLKAKIASLENMIIHDNLTSVFSRRYLFNALELRLAYYHSGNPLPAIIYIDVDHLKSLNDQHGHRLGDKALIYIARQLQVDAFSADVISRIGGDEFAILTHFCGEAEMRQRLKEYTKAISATAFCQDHADLRVSASFGYSCLRPNDNVADFLDRADQSMLDEKALRPNCRV